MRGDLQLNTATARAQAGAHCCEGRGKAGLLGHVLPSLSYFWMKSGVAQESSAVTAGTKDNTALMSSVGGARPARTSGLGWTPGKCSGGEGDSHLQLGVNTANSKLTCTTAAPGQKPQQALPTQGWPTAACRWCRLRKLRFQESQENSSAQSPVPCPLGASGAGAQEHPLKAPPAP